MPAMVVSSRSMRAVPAESRQAQERGGLVKRPEIAIVPEKSGIGEMGMAYRRKLISAKWLRISGFWRDAPGAALRRPAAAEAETGALHGRANFSVRAAGRWRIRGTASASGEGRIASAICRTSARCSAWRSVPWAICSRQLNPSAMIEPVGGSLADGGQKFEFADGHAKCRTCRVRSRKSRPCRSIREREPGSRRRSGAETTLRRSSS